MHNVLMEIQEVLKLSETELQKRRAEIVRASAEVFLRYGFARTTMVDLAAAARVSRPTLYEIFPGKEIIFAAVVQQLSQKKLDEYRGLVPRLRSLRAKLLRFCGDWGTHGLRLVERHPDAKDLFDLDVPAVRAMYEDFICFLVELIASEQNKSSAYTEPLTTGTQGCRSECKPDGRFDRSPSGGFCKVAGDLNSTERAADSYRRSGRCLRSAPNTVTCSLFFTHS